MRESSSGRGPRPASHGCQPHGQCGRQPDRDRVLTILPPNVSSPYPVFVPKTDADGNDIAGIRLPEIAVPLATYTGWGVRAAQYAGNDLCDAAGQQIPFYRTKDERLAHGDPRLSVEERYASHHDYVTAIAEAARGLRRDRLMLDEDVERSIAAAEARSRDW